MKPGAGQTQADEKGIALSIDIQEGARGRFLADPVRIRQIVANLVSNAIKFTNEGSVRIEAHCSSAGLYVIRVQDTGIGFDEGTQARLFARFEQADSSITRTHGGSGLGLSIVRALAELMGGTIGVTSVPALGSTFTVSLPLERTEAGASAAAGEAFPPHEALLRETPLRILVAEDNTTNQRVIGLILETVGANVSFVENGELALNAVQDEDFDVVLMDMQMPVMDGLSATRAIRSWELQSTSMRTPIIMLTANALGDHRARAIEAGCDLHVAKPVTPDDLLSALADVTRGSSSDVKAA